MGNGPESSGEYKDLIIHRRSAFDKQIDRLVYELYGLTEEEIRIVEEGV